MDLIRCGSSHCILIPHRTTLVWWCEGLLSGDRRELLSGDRRGLILKNGADADTGDAFGDLVAHRSQLSPVHNQVVSPRYEYFPSGISQQQFSSCDVCHLRLKIVLQEMSILRPLST